MTSQAIRRAAHKLESWQVLQAEQEADCPALAGIRKFMETNKRAPSSGELLNIGLAAGERDVALERAFTKAFSA